MTASFSQDLVRHLSHYGWNCMRQPMVPPGSILVKHAKRTAFGRCNWTVFPPTQPSAPEVLFPQDSTVHPRGSVISVMGPWRLVGSRKTPLSITERMRCSLSKQAERDRWVINGTKMPRS